MNELQAPPAGLEERDISLDVFRGLAVGGMILVNLQGNSAAAWSKAVHAAWHGLTLADLVFPYFLLAVGMSSALTTARGIRPGRGRILQRAGLLLVIGLVLGWLLRPSFDPDQWRLPGVLQRIALCFAIVALWSRRSNDWTGYAALAAGTMALHWLALQSPAPGTDAASLAPGQGFSAWADQWLPGRLHGVTHDPEGVLSTLSAIATTALGAAAWRLRAVRSGAAAMLLGLTLLGLGAVLAAGLPLPLNKALWTPSFAAVTAGSGILVWLLLAALSQRIPRAGVLRFLAWMGRVALTFYVVHMLLIAVLRLGASEVRLWDILWACLTAVIPPSGLASMAFAIIGGGFCLSLTRLLEKRGWLVRV